MENTLLVGLSRQMMLERQMDVVANNVANVNTSGFKADRSLFEEYLQSGAHEDNFAASDRRVSFVQDRGTFHDFAAGNTEQTKNPLDVAIDGRGFLVVQTPAGERYTRDGGMQINNQGQLVTAGGNPVLGTSGPIVFQPTDHDISIAADGSVTVQEGINHTELGPRQAADGELCGCAKTAEGRLQFVLGRRWHRRPARHRLTRAPGLHREIERQLGHRDEPHDRDHARLHLDFVAAADAERSAQIRHRETRRRSGLTLEASMISSETRYPLFGIKL